MSDQATFETKRTRMNVSMGAKGRVQFEVTAEYPTPEEAAEQLDKAITLCRSKIAGQGLVVVDGQ